ncbi:MAG TPA: response regulator transcription factor [Steroidobacteraceae bacterium]|jgi:DNA-binding NarL/FixJ family response regulator|nr:response regulator transcription factor [Steroidobacteraceae bacterium]
MSNVRILIADDHELIRRGLVASLAERPDWTIVAEAADGRQACELAALHAPDIAVLDLTMPELNGLDVTRHIRASTPKTRILIVTAHESEQLIREVLDAGAMGYVLKSDAGRVLVQAVEALLDERPFFTSKVARFVLDGYLRSAEESASPATVGLSPRERHIVQLLAEGSNNKEVARTLQLSVKTVETHRSNIMRKMEFGSLADLVRYAIRNKIVDA